MEKRRPHFDLAAIKAAFADPQTLNRTYSSRLGADELGVDDVELVNMVQALTSLNFDKSMTSHHDHRLWQDVYKPSVGNTVVYVKFTLDAVGRLLLISFKRA